MPLHRLHRRWEPIRQPLELIFNSSVNRRKWVIGTHQSHGQRCRRVGGAEPPSAGKCARLAASPRKDWCTPGGSSVCWLRSERLGGVSWSEKAQLQAFLKNKKKWSRWFSTSLEMLRHTETCSTENKHTASFGDKAALENTDWLAYGILDCSRRHQQAHTHDKWMGIRWRVPASAKAHRAQSFLAIRQDFH